MYWGDDTRLLVEQAHRVYRSAGWPGIRAWIDASYSEIGAWARIGVLGDLPGEDCAACDGRGATPESEQLIFDADSLDEALAVEPQRCRLCRGAGRREQSVRASDRRSA